MTALISRETRQQLDAYQAMVIDQNNVQNLVAKSTLPDFHRRHVDDALQLIELASPNSEWCDIGSGAGLPGMVIAIVTQSPTTLIEPRTLRAAFLQRVVEELGLENVTVQACRAERSSGEFGTITARAVASVDALFGMAIHLARVDTRWILPRGRNAKKELDAARRSWQGAFTLVPSRTSEDAMILVGEEVRRKGRT